MFDIKIVICFSAGWCSLPNVVHMSQWTQGTACGRWVGRGKLFPSVVRFSMFLNLVNDATSFDESMESMIVYFECSNNCTVSLLM